MFSSTNLLPKWHSLDCIDETEEFQFIIQTLEQIFDLDLNDLNPAYLTYRRPQYVYLILNILSIANNFIQNDCTDRLSLGDLNKADSLESNSLESNILESLGSDKKVTISNKSVNTFKDEIDEISLSSLFSIESIEYKKKDDVNGIKLNSKGTIEDTLIDTTKDKSANKKDELSDEELSNQLKDLRDNKKLINDLTIRKEQNFAMQISFKILDVIKMQRRTKEITKNLDKIQANAPFLNVKPAMKLNYLNSKLDQTRKVQAKKKESDKTKKVLRRQTKAKRSFLKKPSLDLNELLIKLTGLTDKQVNELKVKDNYQKQLINHTKFDLIETERRLQTQMLTKIEKENRLLEMLHKDMNVNANLTSLTKNRLERKQLRQAKSELRKERVHLKHDFDEFYQFNLSNLMNLEAQQEKQLKELARKKGELFKQDLNQIRKEIKEYELKMSANQKLMLDNYDSFYLSQSMLIKQELTKQTRFAHKKPNYFASPNLVKHLNQSFMSRLYPNFH